jgi:hypothetical protein
MKRRSRELFEGIQLDKVQKSLDHVFHIPFHPTSDKNMLLGLQLFLPTNESIVEIWPKLGNNDKVVEREVGVTVMMCDFPQKASYTKTREIVTVTTFGRNVCFLFSQSKTHANSTSQFGVGIFPY